MFYIADGQQVEVKLIHNRKKYPVVLKREGERIALQIGFNAGLREELKVTLYGMKWHGYDERNPRKIWTCAFCEHNLMRLSFMMGMNPYNRYDIPLQEFETDKPLRPHQVISFKHFLTRRQCILAAEMGTGKSLAALSAIEYIKPKLSLWVAPNSALTSVRLEYEKWNCTQNVQFLTYDGLKSYVASVLPGTPAPQVVVFDESHKLKNPTTQRTMAAAHLARSMRDDWGDEAYIFVMSGSPAPKSPIDWFSQCEIAFPGFIREADIYKFKERLSVITAKENAVTGGVYKEIVTWRDSSTKCKICGKLKEDYEHDPVNIDLHPFEPGVNEVEHLYKRMQGLTLVQAKKDVLKDLPEKIYHRIYCKPSKSIQRAASMITKRSESTIKALTLLRELSDGFQYTEVAIGEETCSLCNGSGQTVQYVYSGPEKSVELFQKYGISYAEYANVEDVIIDPVVAPDLFTKSPDICQNCNGKGTVKKYQRQAQEVVTSKDKALIDLLDEYDEVGRLVVYAGFTQSVDRICEICMKQKWDVIRLDGRGWHATFGGNPQGYIKAFQEMQNEKPRVVFVGNPGSAGTGLTLTASPAIVFYSNDFNADSRIQAEDRIHRMGMDINRGAKIIDLIHLPSDEYVLANLQAKRKLQDMSLGLLQEALEKENIRYDYE